MNLQTEYAKRHGLQECLIAAHEGLVFFAGSHIVAAHTGLRPKIHQHCAICHNGGMVLEIINFSQLGCMIVAHVHVDPDANIINVVRKMTEDNSMMPIPMRTGREIEMYVWEAFKKSSSLMTSGSWQHLVSKFQGHPNEDVQQMLCCAINFSQVYHIFISNLHFLVGGRKYLLNA